MPSKATLIASAAFVFIAIPALAAPTSKVAGDSGLSVRDHEELQSRALIARDALDDLIQHIAIRESFDSSYLERRDEIANTPAAVWTAYGQYSNLKGHHIQGLGEIEEVELVAGGSGTRVTRSLRVKIAGQNHWFLQPRAALRPAGTRRDAAESDLERRDEIANTPAAVWTAYGQYSNLRGHHIQGLGEIEEAELVAGGSGTRVTRSLRVKIAGQNHWFLQPRAALRPAGTRRDVAESDLERREEIANTPAAVWTAYGQYNLKGHHIQGLGEIEEVELVAGGSGTRVTRSLRVKIAGQNHWFLQPKAALRPAGTRRDFN